MATYVLKAETGLINGSGLSFRLCAEEYFGCAVHFKSDRSFSPVPYALLCRAIEMKLKSHHLETATQPEVRKLEHDLERAYSTLPSTLQILSTAEFQLLQQASRIYAKGKGFDYVSAEDIAHGCSRFPDLQELMDLTRKLLAQ
jgi:hypothetical protein